MYPMFIHPGLIISIQTTSLQPLFTCTVSPPAATVRTMSPSSSPTSTPFLPSQDETSPLAWQTLNKMIEVVKKTHHSSFYVEKSLSALGKGAVEVGVTEGRVVGGAFPIWLENAPCCPIGIIAVYSGSSHDDHHVGKYHLYLDDGSLMLMLACHYDNQRLFEQIATQFPWY